MAFFGPIITIKNKEITKTEKKFGCKAHQNLDYFIIGIKYCPLCGKEMVLFNRTYNEYASVRDIFGTDLHKLNIHNYDKTLISLCDELQYKCQTNKNEYSKIEKNINIKKMLQDFKKHYKKGIKFLKDNKFEYSIDIALVIERYREDD